ncbi:MAG: saccharopine dehydrogenase NADP-binding domain-containing protein [Pseudomonadota bacterium]
MTPDGTPDPRILSQDKAPRGPKAKLKRVLIIGATGVFGSRLAQHLARDARFELLLASRDLARAEALVGAIGPSNATLKPLALDTRSRLTREMIRLNPWCVVDCSGPFQRMGFSTARAALAAGAHILDLADAPSYLSGYCEALNPLARRNRLSAIAGASSTPALSGAVAAHLAQDLREIHEIEIAITPGGRSPVGSAVIEAMLSSAGREIAIWQNGKPATARGWSDAKPLTIEPLPRRRAALVETLDAHFLGRRHRVRGNVHFRAGLESWPEQLGLETLAKLRHAGLFGGLSALAPLLRRLRQITRLTTSNRGGMQVRLSGMTETGAQITRAWNLIAEQGHGPFVPILPMAATIKALAQRRIGPGAKLAPEVLCLDEIMQEATPYALTWQTLGPAVSPALHSALN